jgi:hypothetical protein
MKKTIFTLLVTAIFALTPMIALNAQSDCDLVFDFEKTPDSELFTYAAVNSGGTVGGGTVAIIEEPNNTTNHVLKTTNTGGYGNG